MYSILALPEFEEWLNFQPKKIKAQIFSRLFNITEYGHFGVAKRVSDEISELKWKSGIRVYFAVAQNDNGRLVVLLLGGNKNSQKKDIVQAKRLFKEYAHEEI